MKAMTKKKKDLRVFQLARGLLGVVALQRTGGESGFVYTHFDAMVGFGRLVARVDKGNFIIGLRVGEALLQLPRDVI